MKRNVIAVLSAILVVAAGMTAPQRVVAQGGAALVGTVTSQEEGKMEGVLVIVRGEGANHTVTVVSDARGKYSFPRTHVPAGKYSVAIRAIGYDLTGPSSVEVP